MNNLEKAIRPIVLALIRNKNKLLVFQGRDNVKEQIFFRLLGGGIEFGEKSDESLRREMKEELNAEIKNLNFVKTLENIFNYEGKDYHELVFIYAAEFVDDKFYNLNEIDILDSKNKNKAIWVDIDRLKNSNFFPEGIKEIILKNN
jgi:ADP-ribose pyrophosphatase YjhB (NUDIX family)